MTTKYIVIKFVFDSAAWKAIIAAIPECDREVFAGVIGVDKNTLRGWQNSKMEGEFPYPNMTNFLRACNALDLDPRQFFVLQESE